MTKLGISVFLVAVILLAGASYFVFLGPMDDNIPIINPTPAPAPSPTPTPLPTERYGYASGHVTIGPNCPVERVGQPCPTPPEAYSSREIIIYKNDGITVEQKGKIDASGNYRIALALGNYFVQISPAGIGLGEKKPVTIKPNQTTVVDFNIDTGIR